MSAFVLITLAQNELRLRTRRLSTIVTLLIVIAISWAMITDPRSGESILVFNHARVLYTSSALALSSAALGGLLFGLAGFYLVRGRVGEDLRTGIGSVIAVAPISNSLFLLGRWLGGVAYLIVLALTLMATVMLCQTVRGDGSLEPMVYLEAYAILLLPLILFNVSCAILLDSFAPLMGKAGDVLFFIFWVAQLSLAGHLASSGRPDFAPSLVFDFTSIATVAATFAIQFHTADFALGISPFDPKLTPIVLSDGVWSAQLIALRCASAAIALLPLLLAVPLFHRYSPDRVKPVQSRLRRSPLGIVNQWLRPLATLVQPLFRLAPRLPGLAGQIVADVALTLVTAPFLIAALLLTLCASLLIDANHLGGVLLAAIAGWGIAISDIGTRDFQAGVDTMCNATRGGKDGCYVRHLAAPFVLGIIFVGPIVMRWLITTPLRSAAALAGLFALSALATLSGRTTQTSRTFIALFLFGLYVAVHETGLPMLDVVGFNGVATAASATGYLALGAAATLAGFLWNRRTLG